MGHYPVFTPFVSFVYRGLIPLYPSTWLVTRLLHPSHRRHSHKDELTVGEVFCDSYIDGWALT